MNFPAMQNDWRREPRSRIARWFNDWVPRWLRDLLGIHIDTQVFLNSDDPPRQTIWLDKKAVSVVGLVFILAGRLVYTCAPYWSSVLAGLGTTLIGLSIYWLLQERR